MQRLANMKITRVRAVITTITDKPIHYSTEGRVSYGILFSNAGKMIFNHNGKEIVSKPGTVTIIPQGAAYFWDGFVGSDFPMLNFNCETTTPITEFLTFDLENQEVYMKYFYRIKELSLFGNSDLKIMYNMYKLMDLLVTEYNQKNYSLMPAITYIENHYPDPELTNMTLAQRLNFSEVYMRRLFKHQFGITPKQYILDIRLQQSTQLLCETKKTVSDIAIACGFSSLSHFSRAFKDRMGETPIEYRLKHRGEMPLL